MEKMKEKQSVKSSIVEIASKDNVTKEVIMRVHKIDIANSNGLDFKKEYVEKFKDSLLNKPVVCKYYPIKDDLGDHEPVFDKDGNIIGLETIAIGTIKEVWIDSFDDSDEEIESLYAKADLWNYKYPEIVACVESLFEDDNAESSVEVEIYKYGDNPTQEYRYATDYTYIGNCLLGSNTIPADEDAGVINLSQKEIASAVHKDLANLKNKVINSKKGEDRMSDNKIEFNNGREINYHGKLEVNSLKLHEVGSIVYNKLNPVDPKTGYRTYNYYITDMYTDYCIAEDWDDYKTCFRIPFTIEKEDVVLDDKSEWVEGYLGFIPKGINYEQLLELKEQEVVELNNKLNKVKEELNSMGDTNKQTVEELETKVSELNTKIEELNEVIVSNKEEKTNLDEQITELNSQIEELQTYKDKYETAQKEEKMKELNSKYSKLITKEVFSSERVQKAIEDLNVTELNNVVVEEVAKDKIATETASKKDDSVTVAASKQEDLVTVDKSDYWASPRS